jgi:fructose-1-phosphate kinase PfkB-like protein
VYGFAHQHTLKEIASWAIAMRAAWVSSEDYDSIDKDGIIELYNRTEALSINMF